MLIEYHPVLEHHLENRKLLSTISQIKAEYHEHEITTNNVAKWLGPLMKKAICTFVYIP